VSALAGVRSMPMWRALAVRDFRLLWSSEAVSVVGDQFHFVALSWLVIDLTKSGLALGTVLIAIAVPRAIMLLPFGVLADRRPPRTLMLIAHLARGVVVGAIAALVLTGSASLPLLALFGAVFGVLDALYLPAQQSFVPRTLDADRLPSGNSLLQATLQLASIVGPPLAGAFIVVVGTGAAFVVDSISFFAAAVIVLMISGKGAVTAALAPSVPAAAAGTETATDAQPAPPPDAHAHPSFAAAIAEGIRYVLADPPLRTTLLISMLINFALNGPAAVGMPWLAEIRYDAGPTGLGLLTAGWAAGALGGTLIAGNLHVARPGRVLLAAVGSSGAAMLVVAGAPWIGLATLALAVMGVLIGFTNIIAVTWLQSRIATEMMGRVMSLAMLMGFGITPLSLGVAGWLLDLNATALFLGSGLIVIGVTTVAALTHFPAAFDAPRPSAAATPIDLEAGAAA
jgi:MFS family permease